ncbi:MAG: TniB family NTP-binding protein [Chloroflexi bacterium]|nr:TniB family NTP-binding protein [Chloroflexota bacterium]
MTFPSKNLDATSIENPATPIGRANATLIRYPRFTQLQGNIQLCCDLSKIAGEPQCMILEGATGTGKSTLVKSYASTYHHYETASGTKIPVFYLETPSPVTVKGMAARLLEVLGDPGAHHGTLWSMNSRLIHFIRTCEVQLVILDDFHHLIDRETNRVMDKVSDWLKVLIKEANVPFLVVGLDGTVRRILESNTQLSRLFAIRETLQPFQWDEQNPDSIQEFAAFVAFAESRIGILLTDEIERKDLLYRLHVATNGVVGNVMNLLRYSVVLAQQRQADRLTLEIFSAAFDLRLAEHVRRGNPFAPPATRSALPSKVAPTAESRPESPANRHKKKQKPSVSEVLTTH